MRFNLTSPSRPWYRLVLAVLLGLITSLAVAGTAEACAGSVIIEKVETGQLAPGGTYDITINGTTDSGQDYSTTVQVPHDQQVTIPSVPAGTYDVSEANASAGTVISPSSFTIETDRQEIFITVTNPFPGGRLAIEKVVTGETAPDGPYTFTISGPGEYTVTVDVSPGTPWTSGWLPLGSYTVTEVDPPAGHQLTPNPVVIDEDGETVLVTAINAYPDRTGRITIEKVETGQTAPDGTYEFVVDGPVSFTATVPAGSSYTSDPLPLGEYTVTEVDGPVGHTIEPNPVTIDEDGETVLVTATNPFRDFHGKLAIEKGGDDGGNPYATYDVEVSGPVSFTATVQFGVVWTSQWLPLGTYTVTEVDAPPGHTIEPNPVTIDEDGETVLVLVTNPKVLGDEPTARIAIQKVETGPSAPNGVYTFTITGPNGSVSARVAAGATWTSGELPLGTYTVVEENAPAGHTIVPNPVVLDDDGETVLVIATNDYPDTLPATGGSSPAGLLTLAGVFVAAGVLALVVRKVRFHA